MKFFQGDRCNATLGGGCSILLSYGDVYEVLRRGPPQKVSAPRSLRRQSLYPTELYGPIVLKPAISRGLTPYIVFLGLDNILSEEGIIHGLLLSIYCRVRSHFSRRIELTTELLFFSRLVLALFLRRRSLYTTELLGHTVLFYSPAGGLSMRVGVFFARRGLSLSGTAPGTPVILLRNGRAAAGGSGLDRSHPAGG